MKILQKLLVGIALAFGLAAPAFSQTVPPTQLSLPGPYVTDSFLYQAPNGHEVPYDIIYTPAGIVYIVFDTSITPTDYAAAYTVAQSQVAQSQINAAKIIPLVVPGVVATGNNIYAVRTTQDFSVNSGGSGTTLASIPQMQYFVSSSSTYSFRAVLYIVAGGGGTKIDFGGPQTPTNVIAQVTGISGTSIIYASQITGFLTGPAGSATAVTQIIVEGTFTTNNGGIFTMQFAQSSGNATNSTVKAGSTLTVTQLP